MVLVYTPGHCQSLDCPRKSSQEPVPNPHPKNLTLSAQTMLSSSPAGLATHNRGNRRAQVLGMACPRVRVSATQAWEDSRLKVFREAQLTHQRKWQLIQSGLPTSLTQP